MKWMLAIILSAVFFAFGCWFCGCANVADNLQGLSKNYQREYSLSGDKTGNVTATISIKSR